MKRFYLRSITFIILVLAALLLMPGCASSKKNVYQANRRNSYIDTSQLGRNKYFFSKQYQKKLYKYKKR
jgi:energy-coupling factor transporter transmembrane protein EcfT